MRRNAIAILPHDESGLKLLLAAKDLFSDADKQVQLQAILTLADMPASDKAGTLLVELAASTQDPVLIDGLTSAAAAHSVSYLK